MGGMVQHQHRRIPEIKVSKESMNEINLLPRSKVMSAWHFPYPDANQSLRAKSRAVPARPRGCLDRWAAEFK